MPSWDPAVYGTYAAQRGRPFHELLARVPATGPEYVVDLGCGDGPLTATLAQRWPSATVLGIDSSPDMLTKAADYADGARISFAAGDITTWRSSRPVDVLVANAALQWVPGHLSLLPGLVESLAPGGYLAVQVPGNFDAPSHVLLADLCRSPRWGDRLAAVAERPRSAQPEDYLRALSETGCGVDAWETTYLQVLHGEDPVLGWTRGTALRPILDTLTPDEQAEFVATYAAALRTAYPRRSYGTVFPFRRIFAVAQRPA